MLGFVWRLPSIYTLGPYFTKVKTILSWDLRCIVVSPERSSERDYRIVSNKRPGGVAFKTSNIFKASQLNIKWQISVFLVKIVYSHGTWTQWSLGRVNMWDVGSKSYYREVNDLMLQVLVWRLPSIYTLGPYFTKVKTILSWDLRCHTLFILRLGGCFFLDTMILG